MLEVHISEEEYVHFEVIRAKSNLKRFGQEIKDVVDEEEDTPEEDPKIAERSGPLIRTASSSKIISWNGCAMVPQMYNIFRIFA